jgi:hypothetical protein
MGYKSNVVRLDEIGPERTLPVFMKVLTKVLMKGLVIVMTKVLMKFRKFY